MAQVKTGDRVRVHFTGRLDDGRVFHSSLDGDAVELRVGDARLLPGFEKALIGMQPGETRTARIQAEDAFGDRDEQRVLRIDTAQLPGDVRPQVGEALHLKNEEGAQIAARVAFVSDEHVLLDANHPLAGENLTFEIRLVDIVPDHSVH
jgi:peptidylprolyl isomerase